MFEHAETFQGGETSGHLRLGKLEVLYQELFKQVIADGLITTDERAQLDKMAASFGLDRERLQRLETALEAAYHAQHRGTETIAVDIDLSDLSAPEVPPSGSHDGDELHDRFRAHTAVGDVDRAWCVAQALAFTNAANPEERAFFDAHNHATLIRPQRPLDRAAWHELLFHPEEDAAIGGIFAVVAPAVLLGRLSALRRDGQLPALNPAQKHEPVKSTVQAVRCFAWAAAIFGMASPELHVDPDHAGTGELVPALPPVVRLGAAALSGRSSEELAFLAGAHLAYFREEHIVSLLVPSLAHLEEIFLAALRIGKPDLAIPDHVVPIAGAIEPLLDPAALDQLRGQVHRFVEQGGRADLRRWVAAVHQTSARAGLLLATDLEAAHNVLALESHRDIDKTTRELIVFTTSSRYATLRRHLGITL
ncbi:hypothetical protein LVJ94_09220 [Pendulispora rubella]|uniref:Uncharacterized protein n=1 Tax=Pendulispora rubella TaxID=2741070 RepID=A0ABZ2L958_9BACT